MNNPQQLTFDLPPSRRIIRAHVRQKNTARPLEAPSAHNWRTSDEDEINRRRWRAQNESFAITNLDARHPIFSNFRVQSGSGMAYIVEVRDPAQRQGSCQCVDFRINGLGTCKHVEAVLAHLEARFKRLFQSAAATGSPRIEILLDPAAETLRAHCAIGALPRGLKKWFGDDGRLRAGSPEDAVAALSALALDSLPELRLA